jgi:hypothetical protein
MATETKIEPIIKVFGSIKVKKTISSHNKCISEKFKVPVAPYIKEVPYSNNPEEKYPKIKYFRPASVEKLLFNFKVAKI